MKRSHCKENLVIVAHPDDETLFFAGLMLARPKANWSVICVTDGNADGRGSERRREFSLACKALGAYRYQMWDFRDRYETDISVDLLAQRLSELPTPRVIYTHGPLGEYGHPHHRQVCYAVFQAFAGSTRIFCPSYNALPEKVHRLNAEQFQSKNRILQRIYRKESQRFIDLLPCSSVEGLVEPSQIEVTSWRNHFEHGKVPKKQEVKIWSWLLPLKIATRSARPERPF